MTPKVPIACGSPKCGRETADSVSLKFDVPPSLGAGVSIRRLDNIWRCAPPLTARQDAPLVFDLRGHRRWRITGGDSSRSGAAAFSRLGIDAKRAPPAMCSDVMDAGKGRFQIAPRSGRNGAPLRCPSPPAAAITPILSLARAACSGARAALAFSRSCTATGARPNVMFHEALQDVKDRYLARAFLLLNVFSRAKRRRSKLCNGPDRPPPRCARVLAPSDCNPRPSTRAFNLRSGPR